MRADLRADSGTQWPLIGHSLAVLGEEQALEKSGPELRAVVGAHLAQFGPHTKANAGQPDLKAA